MVYNFTISVKKNYDFKVVKENAWIEVINNFTTLVKKIKSRTTSELEKS